MAFGFWEAILSFLTRQIGLRTDAADPAGSLHAKATNIGNKVFAWKETDPGNPSGSLGIVVNDLAEKTLVSVTGGGFITKFSFTLNNANDNVSNTVRFKLYIDGVAFYTTDIALAAGGSRSVTETDLLWRFKTSFSVTATRQTAGYLNWVTASTGLKTLYD